MYRYHHKDGKLQQNKKHNITEVANFLPYGDSGTTLSINGFCRQSRISQARQTWSYHSSNLDLFLAAKKWNL